MFLMVCGSVEAAQVTLGWNAVQTSGLQGYRLYYGASSGNYTQSVSVGAATSYTLSNLQSGAKYYAAVTAYTSSVESAYSSEVVFTTASSATSSPSATPGVPAPIAPSGTITTSSPQFSWSPASNCEWYLLWINKSGENIYQQWFQASEVTSGSTCSANPGVNLASATYSWWVRGWNDSSGNGEWSSAVNFTVAQNSSGSKTIGAPSLISPIGTISTSTPTYKWQAVSNSTWYYLWLRDADNNTYTEWYQADQITSGSTCAAKPSWHLSDGVYEWWVLTYDTAWGEWSNKGVFYVQTSGGTSSPANPDSDGLVAYWGFDEGGGSLANDELGGHDAILENGAAFASEAVYGNSAKFDGVDDYADAGFLNVSGNALTIAVWFKADDFGVTDARLVSKATDVDEQDHYFMLSTFKDSSSYTLRFRVKTSSGSTTTLVADSGVLKTKTWYHAAAVYDGSSMKIYLNGQMLDSCSKSGSLVTSANAPVWIGNNPLFGDRAFDGNLDDVRIYNRALTASEIGDIM